MARYYPGKVGIIDDDSQEELWEEIHFSRTSKPDHFLPPVRFDYEDAPRSSSPIVPAPSQEQQDEDRPFKKTKDRRLIKKRRRPETPPNEEMPPANESSSNLEEQQSPQNTSGDSKSEDANATSTASQSAATATEPRQPNIIMEDISPLDIEIPTSYDIISEDEDERPPFIIGEMRSVTLASRRKRKHRHSDSESENSDDSHSRRQQLRRILPCAYCHMWRNGIKSYRAKLRNAKLMIRIIREMIRTRQEAYLKASQ